MRHIQLVMVGSVIALLSATNALANVIYDWHSTSPGPYVTATGGALVTIERVRVVKYGPAPKP